MYILPGVFKFLTWGVASTRRLSREKSRGARWQSKPQRSGAAKAAIWKHFATFFTFVCLSFLSLQYPARSFSCVRRSLGHSVAAWDSSAGS